ncbi:purine-nucleoside phosphorylase [Namhaeicola litoreus]|uniref:Purine nucleoside phosphorylase n=1 Tax=Namhaeicola litoreus TaxID=1052145 RepID=A0ABW3Y7A0_9FLAO
MYDKIQETVKFLHNNEIGHIDYGIIMGTGLGSLANILDNQKVIPYANIPHFPTSTVEGHSGNMIYGEIGDKKVLALQGRFHFYEGWTMEQVTYPVRVLKSLGLDKLILSNASGGVNSDFSVGDIMIISDHINLMPEHPLRGKNDNRFGSRFVDMHEPYDKKMIEHIKKIASINSIELKTGVYLALQGPTFETPAEYKMVRILGADAVGMSTVPEVIVAKHMGMKCLGISVITDLGIEGKIESVSHEEVQKAALKAEKPVCFLVENFIKTF